MSTRPLVIFDCDGTLVDSQHVIVACMANAFDKHGLTQPEPEAIRRIVGLSLVEAVGRLVPDADPAFVARVAADYKAGFAAHRVSGGALEPLFPGAREAIEALTGAGAVLGVATGKSRRGLMAVLAHHGLSDHFTTLQTADDHPSKPHPSMVAEAMAEAGAMPEMTWMIGDTVYDIEMARAAGVTAVGVGWGYHPRQELISAGAHHLIDHFDHLPALVRAGHGRI